MQSAQARDMSRTDWRAMLRGLFTFLAEEAAEDKHAADAEWNEAEHPRDHGKFSSKPGTAARTSPRHDQHIKTTIVGGERRASDGGPLPAHVAALKIPPAWRDVTYSSDPGADLLATGRDAQGRRQAIYSKRFSDTQAAAKFARIKELDAKYETVRKQNDEARRSSDPGKRDAADALQLIMDTGIRPGSLADTRAKVKAYGATTLTGRHIVIADDGVRLRFVGKKGVAIDVPVRNADTAKMLRERAEKAGSEGLLFPATNHSALLAYTHTLDGGSFKTKDFRTLLATRAATVEVERVAAPRTATEYRRMVMSVAQKIAKMLGNTPTVALQSYISPTVFAQWRAAVA